MKFRPLIITLILLGSMFVIPGQAASPSPDLAFQLPTGGDWVIGPGESITIEGETIELRGNLTIERGGSLTLRDGAKLIINSSYSGEYRIRVKEGGNFNVIDSEVTGLEKEYTGKIDYNLKKGMNFISIPFKRTNNSVESVLSPLKGQYYKAYVYDSSNSKDPWKFYSPGMDENHSMEISSYLWKFDTENITGPSVILTLPEKGTENISRDQKIYVIFDRGMNTARIPALSVVSGTDPGGWTFEGWTDTFTYNDTAIWSHNYFTNGEVLNLSVSGYEDAGGKVGVPYLWSFRIVTEYFPSPGYVRYTSPENLQKSVNLSGFLSVVFSETLNSSIVP